MIVVKLVPTYMEMYEHIMKSLTKKKYSDSGRNVK